MSLEGREIRGGKRVVEKEDELRLVGMPATTETDQGNDSTSFQDWSDHVINN